MKKIFLGIVLVLAIGLAASCGNKTKKSVEAEEEVALEVVDTTAAADTVVAE